MRDPLLQTRHGQDRRGSFESAAGEEGLAYERLGGRMHVVCDADGGSLAASESRDHEGVRRSWEALSITTATSRSTTTPCPRTRPIGSATLGYFATIVCASYTGADKCVSEAERYP